MLRNLACDRPGEVAIHGAALRIRRVSGAARKERQRESDHAHFEERQLVGIWQGIV